MEEKNYHMSELDRDQHLSPVTLRDIEEESKRNFKECPLNWEVK